MVNCVAASLSQDGHSLYSGRMGSLPASLPASPLAKRLPAVALGAAFVLLWSSGYPAAKVALGHGAPFTLLSVRFLVAGALCAAIAVASGAAWPRGRAAWHSAVVGSLTLALQFGPLYAAVAHGVNVGVVALIVGTMPIVTALMGLSFGDTVRPLQWVGFGIGFAGVALAVGEGIGGGQGAPVAAYLAVLVGLLGISVGTVYQKRLGLSVDVRSGLAIQNLTAGALLLPFAAMEGLRLDGSAALGASLGWLIVVNSLGGFALFFLLLRRGAVSQVAALFFLMPPVTAVLDYLVLGDALTAQKLAGVLVAAFGVYLATRPHTAVPGLQHAKARDSSARSPRQLAAHAESLVDKESPQLLAAVHEPETTLRQPRHRSGAMCQQPVERLDRPAHERDLALAPALVGTQHRQRPRILAPRARVEEQLCERCSVHQPQIHSLAGERMHDVRGIADQRDARGDVARCREPAQCERQPLARQSGRA